MTPIQAHMITLLPAASMRQPQVGKHSKVVMVACSCITHHRPSRITCVASQPDATLMPQTWLNATQSCPAHSRQCTCIPPTHCSIAGLQNVNIIGGHMKDSDVHDRALQPHPPAWGLQAQPRCAPVPAAAGCNLHLHRNNSGAWRWRMAMYFEHNVQRNWRMRWL
jgi:hypothetical protein